MTDGVSSVPTVSRARAAAAGLTLVGVAVAVDALLLLQNAGATLRPMKAVGLAVAAVGAVALVRWAPRRELIATPLVAFVVFRLSLGRLVDVPEDAVIRDAQAGLAVAVIVGGQLAVVVLGVEISHHLKRSGRQPPTSP